MAASVDRPRLRKAGWWLLQLLVGAALWFGAAVLHEGLANPEPRPGEFDPAEFAVGTALTPTPVVSYTLEAVLDVREHHVRGKGIIRWRNASRVPQSKLYFHLYLNAFNGPETRFMREDVGGFRGGRAPETWGGIEVTKLYSAKYGVDLWLLASPTTEGDTKDKTDIAVSLPSPILPDETLELAVEFVARLPSVSHRTGFANSFHMVAQWFPKLAKLERDGTWAHFPFHRLGEFYADFGNYDVTIDVPTSFEVGATGTETKRTNSGGRTRLRFKAKQVHDFAFTAWDGFETKTRTDAKGRTLRCLYPKGLGAVADLELDEVQAAMPQLEASYGSYPYPGLTIVHPPRIASDAGGMEYPMLITTGGRWTSPLLGARWIEQVTVHELAHQWFYGLLASNEHRFPFLDEGLTTFASTDALEHRYPNGSAFDRWGLTLGLWSLTRAHAAGVWDRGAVAQAADKFEDGADYGGLVYSKTAVLLETLRRVYGDASFGLALHDYAEHERFSHPEPSALLFAVEARLGKPAATALRKGLFDGAAVDLRVDASDPAEPIVLVRDGELAFDADVLTISDEGKARTITWPSEQRTLVIPRDGLAAVVIDPEFKILIDHNLQNNAWSKSPSAVAPRLWTQAGFLSQIVMMVAMP